MPSTKRKQLPVALVRALVALCVILNAVVSAVGCSSQDMSRQGLMQHCAQQYREQPPIPTDLYDHTPTVDRDPIFPPSVADCIGPGGEP